MMWRRGNRRATAETIAGADADDPLEVLLRTEQELNTRLEVADQEGDELLAAAHRSVIDLEVAAVAELALSLRAMEQADQSASEKELDGIARRAAEDVQRFDGVPDARIDELADAILRDFLGIAPLGAGAEVPP